MRARTALAVAVVAAGAFLSCARPYPPPGGERDTSSPGLVSTTPAGLAIVPAGDTPVVFRFDERLSERGFSEALVLVSPQDGALRVSRGRSEIRVRIDGGWRPNRIYRVVLLPGARDLFGNERREQTELIFSTGPAIDSTAFAGMVLDRISGAAARSGVIEAVASDGARYTAHSDSSGFFSLRFLPPGAYDVVAYDDQNRNRRRDLLEPVDSGYTVTLAQPNDTVTQIFHVLIPDTTAPRVERAEMMDSMHVRVTFDDHFDANEPLTETRAEVHVLPDSARYAAGVEMMAASDYQRRQNNEMAAVLPPLLPARDIVVRLDRPLREGTYTITIGPVTNLHGLAGSGTARFEARPVVPPPAPPDTLSAPPDTLPRPRPRPAVRR